MKSYFKGLFVHQPTFTLEQCFHLFQARFNWQWLKAPTRPILLQRPPQTLLVNFYTPHASSLFTVFSGKLPTHLPDLGPTQVVIVNSAQIDSRRFSIPVLLSPMNGVSLIEQLTAALQVQLAPRLTQHGVLVDVFGHGVLITGEPGIGKSQLALSLLERGHRLIADDAPSFYQALDGSIIGHCPPRLQNLIAIRGLGIIDVTRHFGPLAVSQAQRLDLIIHLTHSKSDQLVDKTTQTLFNQTISCYCLNTPSALALETLVRQGAVNDSPVMKDLLSSTLLSEEKSLCD